MSLNKKLSSWVNANLITPEQSTKIAAFETQKHSGLFWRATLFIAGLLIGLGILMLVGANWDAIPNFVKFVLDFVVFVAFIYGAYYTLTHNYPHLRELFLILCFLMVAATIGLTAQIYNLDGGWKSFSVSWALLAIPFVCFSQLTFFHIVWLLLLLSGLDFFEKLFDYSKEHFYGTMMITIVFSVLAFVCAKLHEHIKDKTGIFSCKGIALMSGFLAYITAFYVGSRWGFRDHVPIITTLMRFQAHAFVFLFLGVYILLAIKNQDIKRFQRNTILTEIYIFILFCDYVGVLWLGGIGFILGGLMLLLLLYILKKTTRSIKQMEIFK